MRLSVRLVLALSVMSYVATAYAAVTVSVNGVNHTIPSTGEKGWGANVTAWIQAISANTLQPSGGNFTLTADTNFGGSFGLVSTYFKSRSSDISSSGALRLANTDTIGWRNNANDGNLLLSVDSSDRLLFNGVLLPSLATSDFTDSGFTVSDNSDSTKKFKFEAVGIGTSTTRTLTIPDASGTLVLADATQTITGKTLDGDDNTFGDIPYGALALGSSIVNADINASAAIAVSKLGALTASRAVVTDGDGVLTPATTTATEIGYVNGVTSAIQTQLDAKAPVTSPTFSGSVNIGTTAGVLTSASDGVVSSAIGFGTTGQFLTSTGLTTPPAWTTVAAKVTGEVFMTAATTCPSGSIHADGSSVLRTGGTECGGGSCANLFSAISTTYGTADSTHFTLPDTRGVFIRGQGTQTISAIDYTGTQGTTQGDTMQGHWHSARYGAGAIGNVAGANWAVIGGAGTSDEFARGMISDGTNGTPRTGSETRPANITLKYCIVY